jgi:hypothetical protein
LSNRDPGGNRPPSIAACNACATWKYNGTGLLRSTATTSAKPAGAAAGAVSTWAV